MRPPVRHWLASPGFRLALMALAVLGLTLAGHRLPSPVRVNPVTGPGRHTADLSLAPEETP